MRVVIRHTEGCPNRAAAAESVAMALTKAGLDRAEPSFEVVSDEAAAQKLDFRGSPTILIDGKELFADTSLPVGLACRLYQTPEGKAGVPPVAQIVGELERIA